MLEQTNRGLGEILTDISGNLERLVRAEVKLAKVSAFEWVKERARGAVLVVVGAMGALLTVGLLLLSAVARLSEIMKPWQAALLVGAGMGVLAMIVIAVGLSSFRRLGSQDRTTATYEKDVAWKTLPRN